MTTELVKVEKKLTPKQDIMYRFIYQKITDDLPIMFDEAKELYIKHGAQNVVDGKAGSYLTCNVEGGEQLKFFPFYEGELKLYVLNFLTRYIGILVLKGYLKVVPQILLS